MQGEYPQKVTAVWKTSDGKLHTSEGDAAVHEQRLSSQRERALLKSSVAMALMDVSYHSFGTFRFDQAMDERFIAAISKRLVDAGLSFKD